MFSCCHLYQLYSYNEINKEKSFVDHKSSTLWFENIRKSYEKIPQIRHSNKKLRSWKSDSQLYILFFRGKGYAINAGAVMAKVIEFSKTFKVNFFWKQKLACSILEKIMQKLQRITWGSKDCRCHICRRLHSTQMATRIFRFWTKHSRWCIICTKILITCLALTMPLTRMSYWNHIFGTWSFVVFFIKIIEKIGKIVKKSIIISQENWLKYPSNRVLAKWSYPYKQNKSEAARR